jgi:hypothetical protein
MTDTNNDNLIPVNFKGDVTPPEPMSPEFIDQCDEEFPWIRNAPRKWKLGGEATATDIIGRVFLHGDGDFKVICSISKQDDGNAWLHVSYSRETRIPNYDDTQRVKHTFIGPNRYAYAVYPPQEFYVNLHRQCLHLWCPLEGQAVIPEFSKELIEGMRSI